MALIKTEGKLFIFLLGFSAISIAAWAAIFSIIGLATIFSGASYTIIAGMSVVEFGKIVLISYLYRHWKDTKVLKIFLTFILVLAMVLTSGGVFGYLSYSYQGETTELDKFNTKITILEQQKENLLLERDRLSSDVETLRSERKSTIENRNTEIMSNTLASDSNSVKFRSWRNKQVHDRYNQELKNIDNNINKYVAGLDTLNTKVSDVNDQIADNNIKIIDTGREIGTLAALSRLFDVSMGVVIKWYIFVIVILFDPFAVGLVLALNITLVKQQEIKIEEFSRNELERDVHERASEDHASNKIRGGELSPQFTNPKPYPDEKDVEIPLSVKPKRKRFNSDILYGKNKTTVKKVNEKEIDLGEDFGRNELGRVIKNVESMSIDEYETLHDSAKEMEPIVVNYDDLYNSTKKRIDSVIEEKFEKITEHTVDESLIEATVTESMFAEEGVRFMKPEENNETPDSLPEKITKSSVTVDEIKEQFDTIINEEKLKNIGKKTITYDVGGTVTVDHSIQE